LAVNVFIIHQLEKNRFENDSSNTVYLCNYICGVDYSILLYLESYLELQCFLFFIVIVMVFGVTSSSIFGTLYLCLAEYV